MWWPIWIALTVCVILLTGYARDRSACVAAIIVLGGLIAMQAGILPQYKHVIALTIWCVCLAIIVISTKPSILTLLFALLVPACYIPAVFGANPLDWYRWSDVAGILLLLSLGASGVSTLVGGASGERGFVASGDVHPALSVALRRLGLAKDRSSLKGS
jgi:hypothetical protein